MLQHEGRVLHHYPGTHATLHATPNAAAYATPDTAASALRLQCRFGELGCRMVRREEGLVLHARRPWLHHPGAVAPLRLRGRCCKLAVGLVSGQEELVLRARRQGLPIARKGVHDVG